MKTLSTIGVFSTMCALPLAALAAPASPGALPAGHSVADAPQAKDVMLRNLDDEMDRTGRVALPDLGGTRTLILVGQTGPVPEAKVDSVSAASPKKAPVWLLLRDDPTLNVQYGEAFVQSVAACRFVVAHEMGVSPVAVQAGIVTFRWTIEPSGRVRDASAVADSPTDDAVTACATRVVVSRVLLNPVTKPLSLEWTYSFRKISQPALASAQDVSK